jgi:PKD repeat protein
MFRKKNKIVIVIGITFLLLGAGVVLGKTTQQPTKLSTQPIMNPADRDSWTENFDAYDTGSALMGQGGWFSWDGNFTTTAYVSDNQSRSSPNSVEIKWTTTTVWEDMVHTFTDVNTGNWTFKAWLYVPSDMTGNSFFILMNNYVNGSHTNNADWSLQLEFSASGGTIFDYNDNTKTLPLVTDAWTPIQVEINFDIDQQAIYYNGQFLESTSWKNHVAQGGQQNLAAVDLYADSAYSTSVYWDDLSVLPPAPPLTCDAGGPYTGYTGAQIQFTGSATGGTPPYTWLWQFGDGTTSTQQNPAYAYTLPGLYAVNLTVTDSAQVTAEDETTATITIAPAPDIQILNISGGKGISAIITNTGNADASMVPWKITLSGGIILKGKNTTGTIIKLGVGEKHTISASVFGIGRPTITVSAADKQKTAKGFVFLIFVLGLK